MDNTKVQQTFKSVCQFGGKQRHCQLAAVVCLTTALDRLLYIEIIKVYVCLVVADTNSVDDTTCRTGCQLVKQQIC